MKHTKRILAVVLTLALALSLALPAMAAKFDWDKFYVTKRPGNMTIKHGESFTLSAAANIPEWVTEVEYRWSYFVSGMSYSVAIEGATSPELQLGPGDPYYPEYNSLGGTKTNYTCVITAYVKDDEGNELSSRFVNASGDVRIPRTLLGKLYDLTITPFVYAFGGVVGLSSMTMGILLPFAPIIFLGGLILGFFEGVRGLFDPLN